jgi:hypothetical protein
VGLATAWVFAYCLFAGIVARVSIDADRNVVPIEVMVGLMVPTWLIGVGLLVYYVRDSRRNPRVTRRTPWTIALVGAAVPAWALYWWRYVKPAAAA